MKLAKAMFAALEKKDSSGGMGSPEKILEVNFNPKELSLERTVDYVAAANTTGQTVEQVHKGASNFSLSMTLYFDTFEEGANVRAKYMTKLESFTKPKKAEEAAEGGGEEGDDASSGSQEEPPIEPPPSVLFVWGKFRFCGVIESLSQKYTMF